MNNITLDEFSTIFKYIIENNKRLVENNKYPIAIGIEGTAGLGKTSVVEELANELSMTFIKLNLSQLEEVGDLTGFPIKEYETIQNNEHKWVPSDLIDTLGCDGDYKFTGETRMSYATPAWLPKEENPNGVILLLDDYTRKHIYFQ